jgi:hypothetical protein
MLPIVIIIILLISIIVLTNIGNSSSTKLDKFCLYDKPYYFHDSKGLDSRWDNNRCTAYCSNPNSDCVIWCD